MRQLGKEDYYISRPPRVRLVSFEPIRDWELFDADEGKDLAIEIREYYIPDFSDWKNHDPYAKGYQNLLRDLKTEGSRAA